jgi:hypothetical protein
MSFFCDAFYLVEPLPALAQHLRGHADPNLTEILLEPLLFRRREGGSSDWLNADREALAKLLFLASLREYAKSEEGFAALFGSASVSVAVFDRWFQVRRFEIEQELELLEPGLRESPLPVEPTGRLAVDEWLSKVRGSAEQGAAADRGNGD